MRAIVSARLYALTRLVHKFLISQLVTLFYHYKNALVIATPSYTYPGDLIE